MSALPLSLPTRLPFVADAWGDCTPPGPPRPAGAEAFDFLLGRWTVVHRTRARPLDAEAPWTTGTGAMDVRPVLGGAGNLDDAVLDGAAGRRHATSLRLFDAASGTWSLRRIDERTTGIDDACVGTVVDGVVRFERDDALDGRPMRVRWTYADLASDRARCTQAHSIDGGATWIDDATMDFTRTASLDPVALDPGTDGRRDFDFLHGRWHIAHRKLGRRLVGDTTWRRFGGTSIAFPILGGLGNYDDNLLDGPDAPYRALTVRRFDPATRQWSIWWIDARINANAARVDPPVVGTFDARGVGRFECDDTLNGTPIRVRYLWTLFDADGLLWQQAFSTDGGVTWEDNWDMMITRTA